MQALRFRGERALLDQVVEQFAPALGRIERLHVELRTENLPRLLDLLTHRAVVLGTRDLVSVDTRDIRAFIEEPAETLDADETQPRPDDDDEHEHHQALLIAKEI